MNVVVRTDASRAIGLGHAMRCLALVQAWDRGGGRAVFAMAASLPEVDDRLAREGYEVPRIPAAPGTEADARLTVETARAIGASGIVIDGYQFDDEFQRVIKTEGLKLACIDDVGHAQQYYADVIVNQNLHAEEVLYRFRAPGTVLLLGTSYALLRREFWPWLDWRRETRDPATRVLVTIGGTDAENVTGQVMRTLLQEAHGLEVEVMIGAGFDHAPVISEMAGSARFPVRVRRDVDDVPALMAWADVAISAGGSSIWELAFMQVPVLGIGRGRQEVVLLAKTDTAGISRTVGVHPEIDWSRLGAMLQALLRDTAARQRMADLGRMIVDGRGGERVVKAIREVWM